MRIVEGCLCGSCGTLKTPINNIIFCNGVVAVSLSDLRFLLVKYFLRLGARLLPTTKVHLNTGVILVYLVSF